MCNLTETLWGLLHSTPWCFKVVLISSLLTHQVVNIKLLPPRLLRNLSPRAIVHFCRDIGDPWFYNFASIDWSFMLQSGQLVCNHVGHLNLTNSLTHYCFQFISQWFSLSRASHFYAWHGSYTCISKFSLGWQLGTLNFHYKTFIWVRVFLVYMVICHACFQ